MKKFKDRKWPVFFMIFSLIIFVLSLRAFYSVTVPQSVARSAHQKLSFGKSLDKKVVKPLAPQGNRLIKSDLNLSPEDLAESPKLGITRIEKLRTGPGKYRLGFIVQNWGKAQKLRLEVSCLIKVKGKSEGEGEEDVLWQSIWSGQELILFSAHTTRSFSFSQPDQEINLRPGSYQAECQFKSPEEGLLDSANPVLSEFTVPPANPLLELTQIRELSEGGAGIGLSLQVRNLGLAYQPVPFAVDCQVLEAESNHEIAWNGVIETTSNFPAGTLLDFPLTSPEEKMDLDPGGNYLASCEFLPSQDFEVKNTAPITHKFRAPASSI